MKKIVILAALVLLLVLTASCQALGLGDSLRSVVIPATGSSYLVTDLAVESDPEGYRDQINGDKEFIQVGYSNKIADEELEELVVAVGLVKFDLSALKGKEIKSATLQMYSLQTSFSQTDILGRAVDLNLADNAWDPVTVSYNTKPVWSNSTISRSLVYAPGVWYSWDVGSNVVAKADEGEISFAAGTFLSENVTELIVFSSVNAGDTAPRLLVTYTSSNASFLPWWLWLVIVVVVAVIVFIIVWSVMRRKVRQLPPPPPPEMPRSR